MNLNYFTPLHGFEQFSDNYMYMCTYTVHVYIYSTCTSVFIYVHAVTITIFINVHKCDKYAFEATGGFHTTVALDLTLDFLNDVNSNTVICIFVMVRPHDCKRCSSRHTCKFMQCSLPELLV